MDVYITQLLADWSRSADRSARQLDENLRMVFIKINNFLNNFKLIFKLILLLICMKFLKKINLKLFFQINFYKIKKIFSL